MMIYTCVYGNMDCQFCLYKGDLFDAEKKQ